MSDVPTYTINIPDFPMRLSTGMSGSFRPSLSGSALLIDELIAWKAVPGALQRVLGQLDPFEVTRD